MVDTTAVESLSLTEQLVLLAVADAEEGDDAPAQTHLLRHLCQDRLADVDAGVVGSVTEADVMRSLYRLESEGIVEERQLDDQSPTGKGRPAYTLSGSREEVYDAVSDELLE
jgi:hypothetical protein